jgi:hypothetical protein
MYLASRIDFNYNLRNQFAFSCFKSRKLRQALNLLERNLAILPGNKNAILNKSLVLLKLG